MSHAKFAIIGGDLRSLKLAKLLHSDKNQVNLYGFDNGNIDPGMELCSSLDAAISNSDIVIGPIPCSNDGETINSPFSTEKIYMKNLFNSMSKKQIFLAGRISEKIEGLLKFLNIECIDLLEREEMSVLNAIPTAEGAIQIAMEHMFITLHSCNALVIGFGRIGKTLTKILAGLGSNVYVSARKCSDIAWVNNYHYTPILMGKLKNYISDMDVIFNTVPHLVLDSSLLKKVDRECIIIDLASRPGGVDFDKAKDMGLGVVHALSLPGKVAPTTAAKFIRDTIYNVVLELKTTRRDGDGY